MRKFTENAFSAIFRFTDSRQFTRKVSERIFDYLYARQLAEYAQVRDFLKSLERVFVRYTSERGFVVVALTNYSTGGGSISGWLWGDETQVFIPPLGDIPFGSLN